MAEEIGGRIKITRYIEANDVDRAVGMTLKEILEPYLEETRNHPLVVEGQAVIESEEYTFNYELQRYCIILILRRV